MSGILLDEYDGDAFDEAFIKPWLALEHHFQSLGREIKFDVDAWTLELGTGMQINLDSVTRGVEGIKNYLIQKCILSNSYLSESTRLNNQMMFIRRANIIKYFAPIGGMIQDRVNLGKYVKVGDIIYKILSFNKQGELPQVIDIRAQAEGLVYDISTNQAVNEGKFVMGVG